MKFVSLVLLLIFTSPVALADGPPDPETWYRDAYAPLWEEAPGSKIDEILSFYADEVADHAPDGTVQRIDKASWLREPMQTWLADGWLSSELVTLVTNRINATTASFMAGWRDSYAGAADELACGWYLADYQDGAWRFTAYADIDCAAHGFTLGNLP